MVAVPHQRTRGRAGFEFVVVDADPLRATIRAWGELDLAAQDSIAELLGHHREAGRVLVRLDLSGVTFLDCSCLRVLVEQHRLFLAARGLLVLTDVAPRVIRLLELTGLDQILFASQSMSALDDFELAAPRTPDPVTGSRREPVTVNFNGLMAIASARRTTAAPAPVTVPAQLNPTTVARVRSERSSPVASDAEPEREYLNAG